MNILEKLGERQKTAVLLVACLAAAVLVRLPYADGRSSYYDSERLRDLAVVERLAGGETVNFGPPSCLGGFNFGPLYYQIMTPLAAATGFRPYSLAVTSFLFSLATVILTYLTARRWWADRRIAAIVIVLASFSCLDWQFAKYASNPNFVAFFTLLAFYSYERLISGGKKPWVWAALGGAGLAAAMQLHAIPFLALPLATAALIVMYRSRLRPAWAIPFVAGILITSTPYFIAEMNTGFSNVKGLLELGLSSHWSGHSYWNRIPDYLGFWISHFVSSHLYFNVFNHFGAAVIAGAGLLLVPILPIVNRDRRNLPESKSAESAGARPEVSRILAVWMISVTLVMFIPSPSVRGLYYYYFTPLMPAAFFVMALGFHWLYTRGYWRTGLYIGLLWMSLQIWQIYLYQQYVL